MKIYQGILSEDERNFMEAVERNIVTPIEINRVKSKQAKEVLVLAGLAAQHAQKRRKRKLKSKHYIYNEF